MLYRIDLQHYLTHAIDYFTSTELLHFQYLILSAKLICAGRISNAAKANMLYPNPEIVASYAETMDQQLFEKEYYEMLDKKENPNSNVPWSGSVIYRNIINPILGHNDIVIICDRVENYIVDAFCHYLKDRYKIEAVDLNELFKEGHIGAIYIDRDEIEDIAVDIRRATGKDMIRSLESTSEGRLKLLNMMSKKDKVKKLKDLGLSINESDKGQLDALLIDAWVNPDE